MLVISVGLRGFQFRPCLLSTKLKKILFFKSNTLSSSYRIYCIWIEKELTYQDAGDLLFEETRFSSTHQAAPASTLRIKYIFLFFNMIPLELLSYHSGCLARVEKEISMKSWFIIFHEIPYPNWFVNYRISQKRKKHYFLTFKYWWTFVLFNIGFILKK